MRSGRSLPTRDDKDGIVTGLRAVSGLFTFWVLAINPGKKLRVAVLRVKSAIELSLIGSKGGFMRYLNTTMRSHLGISR